MLKFYCAPWSRASGVFWLLEELGQPYEIEIVDIRAPGGVPESYREIQPNKKVPAIDHDGTVVTERAAICIYLADAFPEAGLAPAIGDKARAGYLTWLVYCDSVFDPAIAARAQWLGIPEQQFLVRPVRRHGRQCRKAAVAGSPTRSATVSPRPTRSLPAASTSR